MIAAFDAANADLAEAVAALSPSMLDERIGDVRDRASAVVCRGT